MPCSRPPVDTLEQELNEANSDLVAGKFNEEQKESALNAMRLMVESVRKGQPSKELQEAFSAAKDEPWLKTVELDPRQSNLDALQRDYYDPKVTIERLKVPMFLAFGGADLITPYRQYVPLWRNARRGSAAREVTIKIYPGANHGILAGPLGASDAPFAFGAVPAVTNWMRQQAGLSPKVSASSPAMLRQDEAFRQLYT